ncbi:hypothetical protein H9P43_002338 [Blastocladiella emersonii ATCC 22665]|nr:hypothetical protein H9P43_002338 [Blastocladiella emersonii ATCC 22665]
MHHQATATATPPPRLLAVLAVTALALVALTATPAAAAFPPTSEWCYTATCPLPAPDAINGVLAAEARMFGTGAAECGDGICNIAQGETCGSCPNDCGACQAGGPRTKCVNRNQYAFSFDDGPSAYTAEVIKHFANAGNLKTTFFVIGRQVLDYPQYARNVKAAFDAGHEIGSHTFTHRSLGPNGRVPGPVRSVPNAPQPFSHMRTEMVMTDLAIQSVIGRRPVLMRPPFLETRPESLQFLETAGYTVVNILVDTNDWKLDSTPQATADKVYEQWLAAFNAARGEGSWIHLSHDILPFSVAAVPRMIDYIKKQGIEIVTVGQCLGISTPYRGANDNPFLNTRLGANAGTGSKATGAKSTTTTTTTTALPTATAASNSTNDVLGGNEPAPDPFARLHASATAAATQAPVPTLNPNNNTPNGSNKPSAAAPAVPASLGASMAAVAVALVAAAMGGL